MSDVLLTTSWDDGHPSDQRLAELLNRHGIAATFYVPVCNGEGRAVLQAGQLRDLAAAGFEIGSHTYDHVRLDRLSDQQVWEQISRGRAELEHRLGQPVSGFCLPGGRGAARVRRMAHDLGLTHIRTVEMFRLDAGDDPLRLPTTMQVYPHSSTALLRNLLRRRVGWGRAAVCLECLRPRGLEARLDRMLHQAVARGGVLHLWGHSWEIEALGLWPVLDRFFARAAAVIPAHRRVSNAKVAAGLGADAYSDDP